MSRQSRFVLTAPTDLAIILRGCPVFTLRILQLFVNGSGDCLELGWHTVADCQRWACRQVPAAFEGYTGQEQITDMDLKVWDKNEYDL